jgi:Domain of unknown function (DUF4340)
MNRQITLGLIVVFIVMIGVAWILETSAKSETPMPGSVTPTVAPIWSVDTGNIKVIEISDLKGFNKVRLEKNQKGTWKIMDLPVVVADQGNVANILASIAKINVLYDYGEDLNPADFELDKPDYELMIQTTDGVTHTLDIGAQTTDQQGYYVRLPGEKRILVVSTSALSGVIGYLTNEPLPATITPTVTSTPTITMTPTITETPTPTVTLTPTIDIRTPTPTP